MVVGAKITSAFRKQWAFTCPVLYKFLNCNISIKRTKEFMKLDYCAWFEVGGLVYI